MVRSRARLRGLRRPGDHLRALIAKLLAQLHRLEARAGILAP